MQCHGIPKIRLLANNQDFFRSRCLVTIASEVRERMASPKMGSSAKIVLEVRSIRYRKGCIALIKDRAEP